MKMMKPNWQTTILQHLCYCVGYFLLFLFRSKLFYFILLLFFLMSVKIDYLNFREKDMTIFAEKKKKNAQRKEEER